MVTAAGARWRMHGSHWGAPDDAITAASASRCDKASPGCCAARAEEGPPPTL